ncbi:RNaseH domain-containing protein [Streptomyces sp. NPDC059866]|uniref:RNaseH domain-containing protein n=1 Tax=Streptomyces sp. NPDC059866 TaxID=3346978 RepID=UPI00366981A7
MHKSGGAGRDLGHAHRRRYRSDPPPRRSRCLPWALTTVRLCNHALAWEHRTRHPLPLHAGIQMDTNPRCRRTFDGDTDDAPG